MMAIRRGGQGHPYAQDWDNTLSKARFEFRWCALSFLLGSRVFDYGSRVLVLGSRALVFGSMVLVFRFEGPIFGPRILVFGSRVIVFCSGVLVFGSRVLVRFRFVAWSPSTCWRRCWMLILSPPPSLFGPEPACHAYIYLC